MVMLCCAGISAAQQAYLPANSLSALTKYQDSLQRHSEETFAAKDDMLRLQKNVAFVREFTNALKTPGSFHFGFDSLKRISILKSPDNRFRIITWFIPLNDGTYRYYGTIQMATADGSLKLFPLNDATTSLADPNMITDHKNWLGARYYEMIPLIINGKSPYFILLGWKGNSLSTSKKVIEVLSFDKNEPVFGKNIFETVKNKPLQNRIIFEYSRQNTMTLLWDKKMNLIVFDHLVPYEPEMTGKYEYYGSDSSFDAYKVAWGKLTLLENVALRNDASINDENYKAPKKASEVVIH